ncbi:dihydrolipoyl dehydrogenase [uncultured Vagococcus sp.]|uniref:dihydrolipoyl dehydrogenase n=1 Tax=uncultured Vagococcus sp. TaxID=189676 RepID=UPI002587EB65|nr:dihydrolipoyl dehydrogenase [uncultured Vagococcus sp.]
MRKYNLIVIGAGPGGYVAAIEAAKLGKKVAVIEKEKIGGTCLNVGCIPSKAYLKHASWVEELEEANRFGINNQVTTIDYPKLVERKDGVVNQLQQGIHYLFKEHHIDYFEGEASLKSKHEVSVNGKSLETDFILLATGSKPFVPPINGIDTVNYLTTDTFFDLKERPKKLAIIGGGVIGIELAFAMAPLGVEVSVIEVAPSILMTEDKEATAIIKNQLKKMGVKLIEGATINQVTQSSIQLPDQSIDFDKLLVVTGRKGNLEILDSLSITKTANQKFVEVNRFYQTSVDSIYAVGDIVDGFMLAHAASKEGIKAVRHMFADKEAPLKNEQVPRCVYTHPEIASFGLSENEAKEKGYDVLISKTNYSANGRAIAGNETTGFVKIISEKINHEILGGVIVGANATEMIHTILAVKESEGRLEEIEKMTFAHPTLSEMIGELASEMIF